MEKRGLGLHTENHSQSSQVFHYVSLALTLAIEDIKDGYRRTTIGPFWVTFGLGVQIACIGTIFGLILGSEVDRYIPFLTLSLILWNLIVQTLNDGSQSFIQIERILKQTWVPWYFAVCRSLFKNLMVFFHNLALLPLVFLLFPGSVSPGIVESLLGGGLLVVNLLWTSTLVALASSRFRDFAPIISSLLQVGFYVTPIIWLPEALPSEVGLLALQVNPLFHAMELVRAPLLGSAPSVVSWLVTSGLAAVGLTITLFFAQKKAWRVVYWI